MVGGWDIFSALSVLHDLEFCYHRSEFSIFDLATVLVISADDVASPKRTDHYHLWCISVGNVRVFCLLEQASPQNWFGTQTTSRIVPACYFSAHFFEQRFIA